MSSLQFDTAEKVVSAKLKKPENPFAGDAKEQFNKAVAAAAPANNMFGLGSIQDFSGVFGNHGSDLSQTHGDAQGFYDYMHNFYTPNYWFKDAGVQAWQYEEPYDHWKNLYGVDAVLVFYHSGHGNMTPSGVFQAPMGGKWGTESWFFSNHNAKFANQVSRYIFWSTCLSNRVGGGITPVTTWWNVDNNPGFRLLFGFETVSFDNPNYGKFFWNHWKNNESFSTAWLNASWDISHKQSPTAVASGSNQADATSRLFNERLFYWGAVARNYYQWRWYYAASIAARNKSLPKELKIAELAAAFNQEHVHALSEALDLQGNPAFSKEGEYSVKDGKNAVTLDSKGNLNVKLAEVNYNNNSQLPESEALKIAEKEIARHQLHAGEKYELDVIRLSKTAGSATGPSAVADHEHVTDTTVQFRQVINGIPSVNADAGLIRVTIDNDGTVTHLHSSVKRIAKLQSHPKSASIDPKNERSTSLAKDNELVEKEFNEQLAAYKEVRQLEDSEEIGYDVAHTHGRIVKQRVYEVTMEHGLKKLVKIIVPIYE